MAVVLGCLLTIMVVFIVIRVVTDWPHILDGSIPDDDFAERYVAHAWLGLATHVAVGEWWLRRSPDLAG